MSWERDSIVRRITIYCIGIVLLATGVSIAIQADLGVSPVSSLSYAIALITGISVGLATLLTNFLYLFIQFLITKKLYWKSYFVQIISVSALSIAIDIMVWVTGHLPETNHIVIRLIYLVVSMCFIAGALSLLLSTKLPLMPYDFLVPLLIETYKWRLSTTRISCDLINVGVAAAISLIFLHTLGSTGIGTILSALLIGKILAMLIKWYGEKLKIYLGTH